MPATKKAARKGARRAAKPAAGNGKGNGNGASSSKGTLLKAPEGTGSIGVSGRRYKPGADRTFRADGAHVPALLRQGCELAK